MDSHSETRQQWETEIVGPPPPQVLSPIPLTPPPLKSKSLLVNKTNKLSSDLHVQWCVCVATCSAVKPR